MTAASATPPIPSTPLPDGVDIDGVARCGVILDLPDGIPLGLVLPHGAVPQLLRNIRTSAVPNAPAWFCGLLNRRGNLVPLFDLLHYFGLSSRASRGHVHALVVGDGDTAFALPVVHEPRILPPDIAIDDVGGAPDALAAFVTAAYRHDARPWYDFQFDFWLARLAAGAAPDPLQSTSPVEKPA